GSLSTTAKVPTTPAAAIRTKYRPGARARVCAWPTMSAHTSASGSPPAGAGPTVARPGQTESSAGAPAPPPGPKTPPPPPGPAAPPAGAAGAGGGGGRPRAWGAPGAPAPADGRAPPRKAAERPRGPFARKGKRGEGAGPPGPGGGGGVRPRAPGPTPPPLCVS